MDSETDQARLHLRGVEDARQEQQISVGQDVQMGVAGVLDEQRHDSSSHSCKHCVHGGSEDGHVRVAVGGGKGSVSNQENVCHEGGRRLPVTRVGGCDVRGCDHFHRDVDQDQHGDTRHDELGLLAVHCGVSPLKAQQAAEGYDTYSGPHVWVERVNEPEEHGCAEPGFGR